MANPWVALSEKSTNRSAIPVLGRNAQCDLTYSKRSLTIGTTGPLR